MLLAVLNTLDDLKAIEVEAILVGLPTVGEVAIHKVHSDQELVRIPKVLGIDHSIGMRVVKRVHNPEQG